MAWQLSDGTKVHKGGRVIGTSDLADALRLDIAAVKRGWSVASPIGPMPSGSSDLDLDSELSVDAWLRAHASLYGVEIESGPSVTYPDDVKVSDDTPDDAFH